MPQTRRYHLDGSTLVASPCRRESKRADGEPVDADKGRSSDLHDW